MLLTTIAGDAQEGRFFFFTQKHQALSPRLRQTSGENSQCLPIPQLSCGMRMGFPIPPLPPTRKALLWMNTRVWTLSPSDLSDPASHGGTYGYQREGPIGFFCLQKPYLRPEHHLISSLFSVVSKCLRLTLSEADPGKPNRPSNRLRPCPPTPTLVGEAFLDVY